MSVRRHPGGPALLALVAALALSGSAAAATPPPGTSTPRSGAEFSGFGDASFGTRWAAVRARYPKAQELAEGDHRAAPSIGGPFVRRLLLTAQPVEGFTGPADVELRFWKNQLWTVVVYLGGNPDPPMTAVLGKRLGPPDNSDADNPQWTRGKTQTTAAVKQNWYAVNDIALSGEAQAWFVKVMQGEWKGPTQEELDALADPTPVPRR